MTANRTAQPISPRDVQLFGNINKHLPKRRRAYLGDANNVTEVPNNPDVQGDRSGFGRYYARWFAGVDDNNNAKFGEVFKCKFGTVSFPDRPNLPIYVEQEASSGDYVIVGYDPEVAHQSGIDTRQFNQGSARNYQLVFRMLQNGRTKTHSQSTGNETKLTVQDLMYIWDGTIANAVKGLSNGVELSSYIPSDNTKEVAVALGVNPTDNSIEVIASAETTITNNSMAVGTLTSLVDSFSDYVLPLEVYRIPGGAGTLIPAHRELGADLRQIVNVREPRGFPLNIAKHIHIVAGYQQPYYQLSVDAGTLQVDGLLYEV